MKSKKEILREKILELCKQIQNSTSFESLRLTNELVEVVDNYIKER